MKIRKVLVSQPEPKEDSPYRELASKNGFKIDFRSFIKVEGVSGKEFRKERINILDHTAVVFTSKTAIDHFFRICKDVRAEVPETMKYFCMSESIAFYLQKYIVFRKRKIFSVESTLDSLVDLMAKHKEERFLIPLSDVSSSTKEDILVKLEKTKLKYTKAVLFRTVCSDLSDMCDLDYDILIFFTPQGIKSLFKNFPNFKQEEVKIAAFGPQTQKTALEYGVRVDIASPTPEAPSMTMALEQFVVKTQKEAAKKK